MLFSVYYYLPLCSMRNKNHNPLIILDDYQHDNARSDTSYHKIYHGVFKQDSNFEESAYRFVHDGNNYLTAEEYYSRYILTTLR